MLSEVRELKFALEESNQAAKHLQYELAAAQVAKLPNNQDCMLCEGA